MPIENIGFKWFNIGFFAGIDIIIANFVYATVIVKTINTVEQQGAYWGANTIIWSLILPIYYIVYEKVKKDAAYGVSLNYKKRLTDCLKITLIIICLIPILNFLARFILGNNFNESLIIITKLLPFYIFYVCSMVISSYFIGIGKTYMSTISSLLVNFIYYPIAVYLINNFVATKTVTSIIVLFGTGMIVTLMVNLILLKVYTTKKKFMIN